ncbi:glucosamine-6-phosphate deaminase [Oenococcus alcoholitolerans]|uniref:glucosamine-6-phosphate deaminase n=1 Tax=Oenococcus alcoholitolerans TaxID=931074 RepID=UPI003F71AC2F
MKIIIEENKQQASKKIFQLFREEINSGSKVFGLATGSTPEDFYKLVTESDLDLTKSISINLDEYVGLKFSDPQSYHYFMKEHLFLKKPFAESYLPNGLSSNLENETKRYDKIITENPIDWQILGIGRNGHIGFNEPGSSFNSQTHIADLTESTIKANARFFKKESDVPKKAISMGIASIMKSKKIVLAAFGSEKADAVKKFIMGPITENVPASILQKHQDVTVVLDEQAAAALNEK